MSNNGEKKRKPEDTHNCEMSNGAAKKLKASSEEGGAPVQQTSDSEEVDSDSIINSGSYENETAVSDRGKDWETPDRSRVAVVPEDYPDVKMTEEQAEVVEAALVESICPYDQGAPIQFSDTRYENGALVFTCVNRKTHTWLNKTAQKMVPWPGAKLEARQAEPTLTGSQLVMWVNHKMGLAKRSYEQILELIQKQNKGISTAEWKVMRGVAETERNERLVLWVENRSYEALKAHNFKLFLGLCQVKFLKMSEYKKLHNANQNQHRPTTNKWHHPSASQLPYRLPASVSRPVYGYRGPGLSPQNPRSRSDRFERRDLPQSRELASVDTYLRGAQFTGVGPSQERMYTNRESSFPDSQQLRSRGFSAAEWSRSREASYDRREPRYVQERGYSASYRR